MDSLKIKSKRAFLFVFLSFLFSVSLSAQIDLSSRVYLLTSVSADSDLDIAMIEKIDSLEVPFPEGGNFLIGDLPVKSGKNTVYKFVHAYVTDSNSMMKPMVFHDLLCLSVNSEGKIVNGFHYTLEWQDTPSIRLLKAGADGVKLARHLSLASLDFRNSEGEKAEVNGIIDDYWAGKKLFPEKTVVLKTLKLLPDNVRKDGETVVFDHESNIKKPCYDHFCFDTDEFVQKVGPLPLKEAIEIQVEILSTEEKRYTPPPELQSPRGGFRLFYNKCRIVK